MNRSDAITLESQGDETGRRRQTDFAVEYQHRRPVIDDTGGVCPLIGGDEGELDDSRE